MMMMIDLTKFQQKELSDLEKVLIGFASQRNPQNPRRRYSLNAYCGHAGLHRPNVYKAFNGDWSGEEGQKVVEQVTKAALGS